MPIKVFPDGHAEAETPEEAVALLRLMGQNQVSPAPKPSRGAPVIRNEDDAVTQFFGRINDNARQFLAALANHKNGVKAEEFGEETGFTTDKFGGILGGASRLATKYGLDFDQFVISEMRNEKHARFRFLAPGEMLNKYAGKIASKPALFAAGGSR